MSRVRRQWGICHTLPQALIPTSGQHKVLAVNCGVFQCDADDSAVDRTARPAFRGLSRWCLVYVYIFLILHWEGSCSTSNDKAYSCRMQVVSCRWIPRSSRHEADIESTQSYSLFTADHCHWPCLAKLLTPVGVSYVLEFTSSSGFLCLVTQIVHPSFVCQREDSIGY